MRGVVQRVRNCSVSVDGSVISKINSGLLLYLGISEDDSEKDLEYMKQKVCNLRIFEDSEGKMNLSLQESGSNEIMVISQFTLYGDVRKGRRPSFIRAADPEKGNELYEKFVRSLVSAGLAPQTGSFGSMMDVSYTNHGPVTIIIDSSKLF